MLTGCCLNILQPRASIHHLQLPPCSGASSITTLRVSGWGAQGEMVPHVVEHGFALPRLEKCISRILVSVLDSITQNDLSKCRLRRAAKSQEQRGNRHQAAATQARARPHLEAAHHHGAARIPSTKQRVSGTAKAGAAHERHERAAHERAARAGASPGTPARRPLPACSRQEASPGSRSWCSTNGAQRLSCARVPRQLAGERRSPCAASGGGVGLRV